MGQTHNGRGSDASAGACGNVIEDHRQPAGCLGHGPEVLVDAGLRRAVVVRRDHQHPVDAAGCGLRGEPDRVLGVIGPGAGDHRDGDCSRHGAPQVQLLLIGEHRALARRPAEHETVAPVGRQPAGQRDCRIDIERTSVVEWGHHGGDHTPEAGSVRRSFHHRFTLPATSTSGGQTGARGLRRRGLRVPNPSGARIPRGPESLLGPGIPRRPVVRPAIRRQKRLLPRSSP